jgi:YihY family inner membrane protein
MIKRMLQHDIWSRLWEELKNLGPLFRYLILQTETHAFCLALAAAALIGFFPSCLVMLSVLKNMLDSQGAYDALVEMVRSFFLPGDQSFVTRNLDVRFASFREGGRLVSVLWVLLGAAGVFVPLEAGLNRLWRVQEDRPYWKNQIVGFALTLLFAALGLVSVLVSAIMRWFVSWFPFELVRTVLNFAVIHAVTTCLFIVATLALYKFLPNTKIRLADVAPAAILAGVLVEIVRLLFFQLIPNLESTQGPFAISVTFLLLAYFETFVVLGCAFLASQRDRYRWIGFLWSKETPRTD